MDTKVAPRAKARRSGVREKFPSTPDPIEIAMAAAASGKPLPDVARNVLEKHALLIDRQADLAQAQCSELKLRRVGEGVRAVLWGTLAIAAFAVVALIVAVVIRASRSDALIVQSFRLPPALEAKGLGGEVVATQVLDKLAEMQARTESVRAASSYANNWEDELKIDIPNTGASTSEVWKLLRGWLGKETRISGEIVGAERGLALTARVGSAPGQRFENAAGDLDALVKEGAELIYRNTQPYRYAIYMARDDRESERAAILRQLTAHSSPTERKWAYSGLSYDLNRRGQFAQSIRMAGKALTIDPQMAPALSNAARAHEALGHTQRALDMYGEAERLMPGNREYDPVVRVTNVCGLLGQFARRDPALFDEAAACYEPTTRSETYGYLASVTAALLRHDAAPALRLTINPETDSRNEVTEIELASLRLAGQMERGRSPELAAAFDAYRRLSREAPSSDFATQFYTAAAPVESWPGEAEVLTVLGRTDEARALIDRAPLDCYECVRVRGLVARARGDTPAAQRWFAEAVRQGPRLPAAYVDWGRLLLAHRRFASAGTRFAKAAQLSPNWADPLKYWGDALAAKGDRDGALSKYEAALKRAPKWQELQRAAARLRSRA